MSGTGSSGAASDKPDTRQKVAGTWAGYLIFGLFLLVLIVFDAQAAYNHSWAEYTGIAAFTLAFVLVPTGGAKWLRRRRR
jgi:hypothetical protein